ncbi:MAG TPA: M50 family metallopeptidase [Xanthobacteraceae bacterium]|nr:M50 family metallopeptidase [Xanthobacteraceae bacterium]
MNLDFWHGLATFGIVPFLIVLTIVVFFHELGHFLVARWYGVKILSFSIGFGPELFGFNDRHQTRWKICAIPLGGYVKFFGDENAASVPDHAAAAGMSEAERRVSFVHQKVGPRAAVAVAGPIANFILSLVIFAGIFMSFGRQVMPARVDAVQPDSAAAAAGLMPGDIIVAIDGREISGFSEMQRIVGASGGRTLTLTVDRGGVREDIKATPSSRGFCNAVLGISKQASDDVKLQTESPPRAILLGAEETYFVIERSLCFVAGVFVGRESANQLGGPIRIAEVAGDAWNSGLDSGGIGAAIASLLYLSGFLSASIGLLNLFPVPMLDGGHLLFYAIEAMRGRPLSERAQEVGFRIGLAIVVMLMIFAAYNDISGILHRAVS